MERPPKENLHGQRRGGLGTSWAWLGVGHVKVEGALGAGSGAIPPSACPVGRHQPAPGMAPCRQSAQSFELHVSFLLTHSVGTFWAACLHAHSSPLFASLQFKIALACDLTSQ